MYEQHSVGAGYPKTATDRPPYGYEEACSRLVQGQLRIAEQIERLERILGPILSNEISQIGKNSDAQPGYASAMLQEINNNADGLDGLSVRLESVIGRIRL